MRYFIKAYPMHEPEVEVLAREASTGAVEADINSGLVVGTADAAAVERLAALGIVVQMLGVVPEESAAAPAGDDAFSTHSLDGPPPGSLAGTLEAFRPEPSPGGSAGADYWLADLLTGLTDETIGAIEATGAVIVERDPTGAFVLRTTAGVAELARLPFV